MMYGYARLKSVNIVRSKMFRKIVGKDETLSRKLKIDFMCLPHTKSEL